MEPVAAAAPMRRSGGRLWPNARQEQLLRAGLASGPSALEAWNGLEPGLDLDALDPGSTRLLPLVWRNLDRHGIRGPLMAGLRRRYEQARVLNEAMLEQFGVGLRAFRSARVPAIALKGAALIQSAYGGDVALRPMSDIDVLVPLDHVAAAGQALRDVGWRPAAPVTPAMIELTHSAPFVHAQNRSIDLHWHVFEECCGPADDVDLWAAAEPATLAGTATRVLTPADQLLQACVHGEKWVTVPGLRWIADAVLLIRQGHIDWSRLVQQATKRRFVLRMRAQLEYLRSAFDTPVPPEAFSRLAASPISRLERFEHRWSLRDRRRPWILVYWCNHLRSGSRSVGTSALTFPRYLQAVWRLDSPAQLPAAVATRLRRHLSARPSGADRA